ncbi:hypothetical protein [Aestuariivirga sp.]|uniref:hypothetical protein n=1 Tax=Aestuariivirga sp. TaxID=2650926 RepID=UPI003593164B
MLARGLTVSLAALLAIGLAAGSAEADQRKKQRRAEANERYYAAPGFVRSVPGLRLFFGDYALTEDEYDTLYGDNGNADSFDESYYEPEPVQPAKPRKKPTATAKQTQVPSTGEETGSITSGKDVNTAAASASTGSLSCEKAGSIVSGYGFSSVKAESCKGKIYAFNASRGGKAFAIKLDPASGELTEVKKLP